MIIFTPIFLVLITIFVLFVCSFIGFAINKWIKKDNESKDKYYILGGFLCGVLICLIFLFILIKHIPTHIKYLEDTLMDIERRSGINVLDDFLPDIKSNFFYFPKTCERSSRYINK
jgi:hypothetical protein